MPTKKTPKSNEEPLINEHAERKNQLEITKLEAEIKNLTKSQWRQFSNYPPFITLAIVVIGTIVSIQTGFLDNKALINKIESNQNKLLADSLKKRVKYYSKLEKNLSVNVDSLKALIQSLKEKKDNLTEANFILINKEKELKKLINKIKERKATKLKLYEL